jgi:hypothetical protein
MNRVIDAWSAEPESGLCGAPAGRPRISSSHGLARAHDQATTWTGGSVSLIRANVSSSLAPNSV